MGDAYEFTVVDTFEGVAGGAYLTVDVESTTEGGTVVGRHEAGVVPWKMKGVDDIIGKEGNGRDGGYGRDGGGYGGGCFVAVLGKLRYMRMTMIGSFHWGKWIQSSCIFTK